MADEPLNLEDIITQSMSKTAEEAVIVGEETPEPVVEKKIAPEKKETSEKKESDLSEQDEIQARQLFAALKDPAKAPHVIKFLVESSGVELPETKKEVKEVKKALTERLKEALGPELAYMADKMGPVFQSFLEEELGEVQQKNETRFSEQALEKERNVADHAQRELARELFGQDDLPAEFIAELSGLIDIYPPTKGQTTHSYLKDLIHLASGRLGKPITKQQPQQQRQTEKATKNRNDAVSHLASDGKSPAPGREVSTRTEKPQPKSLEDAVRMGLEEANALLQTE